MEKIMLEDLKSKKYDFNVKREGEDSDTCSICGKRTQSTKSIHLHVDGHLISKDANSTPESEDQGCFPVGSECLKKIPSKYII